MPYDAEPDRSLPAVRIMLDIFKPLIQEWLAAGVSESDALDLLLVNIQVTIFDMAATALQCANLPNNPSDVAAFMEASVERYKKQMGN